MNLKVAEPTRLIVRTLAGPVEVAAAAAVAAAVARDVFSSDIREQSAGPGFIAFLVTSPLAHAPSLRLQVSWTGAVDGTRSVAVDVETVSPGEVCSESRSARTWQAVDRFNCYLEQQLSR